jgi:voltage-gated potassium channel
LKGYYIVCGFGRVGAASVEYFKNSGAQFVVVDVSESHLQSAKEQQVLYHEGDATSESVLMDAGIKNAKGLLALLGSDPDNLFLV